MKTKDFFCLKTLFPQNIPLGSSNGNLATTPIFFVESPGNVWNVWSSSEKHGKNYNFWKKNPFFPKRSSRLIESSFDKRSEMFLLKVRKWQNSSSNLRKHFLRMSFFWSIMQFREHSRKNLPFSERFCLKVWKRRNFFKKNIVLKMFPWALPTALRPPYQFFLPKVQEMIDPNPKNMENRFFEKKSFFSQNDPQRSKKAVLTNAPNCFCQKSEIDKIGTRMSGKISEKFLWSRKLQFIERSKNNCLFRPCLAQSMKKKIFFLKKRFSQTVTPG